MKFLHGNQIKLSPYGKIRDQKFSMLEVNKAQYESSMKKFKIFAMTDKKRSNTQANLEQQKKSSKNRARSLKQVWQVLNLDNLLQNDEQKLPLHNREGKQYYQAHMRMLHHIGNVKTIRPKSKYSSSRRAKT